MMDLFRHLRIHTSTKKQERKNKMKGCVKVCKLDSTGKYCTACGRTIEEITERGKQNIDGNKVK